MNDFAMQNDDGQADILMFVNCELRGWVIGLDPCRMVTVLVAPRVMAHQLRHLLRLLWVCAPY